MKRLEIRIGTLKDAADDFSRAWHAAAKGRTAARATSALIFETPAALYSAISDRRLALVRHVAVHPGLSIRALAAALRRDYKRVHTDVSQLERLGLVRRNEAGRLHAPYDEVVIRAPLRVAA